MTISDFYYRSQFSLADSQENIDFDTTGNEIYHGWAPNTVSNTQAGWVIAKGVYTTNNNVSIMTHVSFLRNQIWNNRTSIVFP